MIRLVLFLVGVAILATALAWLADRPGNLVLTWQGYEAETTVFRAVVILCAVLALAVLAWSILRQVWATPAVLGRLLTQRRQERGLDALSSGMIAVGAGDRALATRYALQARRSLPNEPLTHLLRAQAAQLSGDRTTSRRIFEAMLATPDTEQLGLRGLFLEAERAGEPEAARQFAERALKLNPKLSWPVDALFEIQCAASDWDGALETLAIARRHGHVERSVADRRRAVLLTAQAQEAEDTASDRALALATEAHGLAPDLIPAAAIAGRMLASRGNTAKAARILEKTWKRAPHPELAVAHAYARPGDSPRDRLERVKRLARSAPHSIEGPIAIAVAAIEARSWDEARKALAPLLETRLTQRVCTLMARIEGEQMNDAGRVRQWLARAVNAPRDPAWTADGVVSDHWAPTSPVTGALDAFEWRIPVEPVEKQDNQILMAKVEELVGLGARPETAIEAKAADEKTVVTQPYEDVAPKTEPKESASSSSRAPEQAPPDPQGGFAHQESPKESVPTQEGTAPVAGGRASTETPSRPAAAKVEAPLPDERTETRPATGRGAPKPKVDPPRVFVPPRPPDDPGLDDAEERLSASYLSPAAKRPL
jgi:HemY protein